MKGIDDHSRGIIETFNIVHTEVVDRLSDLMLIPKSFNPLIDEKRKQRRRQSQEMLSPTVVSSQHQRNTSNGKPHWQGLGLTQNFAWPAGFLLILLSLFYWVLLFYCD